MLVEKNTLLYKSSFIFFLFLTLLSLYMFSRFTVDDAFITFRYGKNLVDFGIWNYNPSNIDLVQAYSNPIYAVLSIVPNFFGWDVVLFFKIFSLLTLFTFCLWFLLRTEKSWIMLLLFLSMPATIVHAFSGLETFLYAFLLSLLLVFLYEEKFWGAIIVTCFLFMTRGESWSLVALVPLYFLLKTPYFDHSQIKNNTSNYLKNVSLDFPKFFISLIILSLVLIFYFYYHHYHFGSILPNTYYVKSAGTFSMSNFIFFSILLLPLLLAIPVSRLSFIAIIGAYFLAILFVYSKSDLQMNYATRFGFHIFAPIFIFTVYLRKRIINYWSNTLVNNRIYSLVFGSVIIIFLVKSSISSLYTLTYYQRALDSHAQLGKILNSISNKYHIKAYTFGDAGMVAYHSKINSLDNVGLANSYVARHGIDNQYLDKFNPDLLMFYSDSKEIMFKLGYHQKEIYDWGVNHNFKKICGVYWQSNYVIDIYGKKDTPEIENLCNTSKEKNSLDEREYLIKDIMNGPWKYWHE